MITLADMILASAQHRRLLAAPAQPRDGDGGPASSIPVVVADAVAEFFFAGTPQEDWDFGGDFPRCVPPASPIFIELARPARIVSGVHGLSGAAHLPPRWGWRFEATGREELADSLRDRGRGPALERHYRGYADALTASGRVDVVAVHQALGEPDPLAAARRLGGPDAGYFAAAGIVNALDELKAGAGRGGLGWLLHGGLILEHGGRVAGPVATLDVVLDRDGRPMPPPLIDIHGGGLHPAVVRVLRATILPLTFPAFMTLTLINTEGATLRPVDPDPELARRHAERGLPTPVRYHRMDIGAVAGVERN